jgi:transposase
LYINLLLQYQGSKKLDALAKEVEEFMIIQSIPGIGGKIAATVLSEIVSVFSSGKFNATTNRITKRGSKQLRHSLYLPEICGLKNSRNKKLREYYDRKREEGKPYRWQLLPVLTSSFTGFTQS